LEVEKGRQVRVQGGNAAKENATVLGRMLLAKLSSNCAASAVASGQKKKRQPSAIASAGAVSYQGLVIH
jgi:hypothetical protein